MRVIALLVARMHPRVVGQLPVAVCFVVVGPGHATVKCVVSCGVRFGCRIIAWLRVFANVPTCLAKFVVGWACAIVGVRTTPARYECVLGWVRWC